jgi:hypothetical protein
MPSSNTIWLGVAGVVIGLVALSRCNTERSKEPESRAASTPAPAPAPAPAADDGSYRFPAAARVVAFGDVHGDVGAVRAVLRLAQVVDDEDHWTGGKTVVVQTGDQLDRGDDEPEILDWFDRLAAEAKKAGGAFHVLDGNHEVMNVAGDFRYVTPGGFADFEKTPSDSRNADRVARMPEQERGRALAFLPGGPMARRLAQHPIAIVVGDTVFVHGGILPSHVRYGIGRINEETRRWMLGETPRIPAILDSESAPIWLRQYSDGVPSERACADLGAALEALRAKRMVVGHTVQSDGITSGCDERVWRIDVGLAAHYGGRPAALEIDGVRVKALAGTAPGASD